MKSGNVKFNTMFWVLLFITGFVFFCGCGEKVVETKTYDMNQKADLSETDWTITNAETSAVLKAKSDYNPDIVATPGNQYVKVLCDVVSKKGDIYLYGNYHLFIKAKNADGTTVTDEPIKNSDYYSDEGTSIIKSGKNAAFKIEEVFAVPREAKDLTLIIEKKPFEEVEARAAVNLITTKDTSASIIPEMEAFLAGLDGTGGTVGKLLKKYGTPGLDAKDMDLYNLKDGQIVKIYQVKDRVAYKVNIKSGLTTRSYKLHWLGGKIVAVEFLGLL
ncbi:MAG: hypothetical protein PVH61_22770 [Candidatus Aminicenantes bacterium]